MQWKTASLLVLVTLLLPLYVMQMDQKCVRGIAAESHQNHVLRESNSCCEISWYPTTLQTPGLQKGFGDHRY